MTLKLMYITNNEKIAKIAEQSGVDWIFIDLEINGKEDRQGHLDTVISRHHMSDVKKIKSVLTEAELLVRTNPLYENSQNEIDEIIDSGADIVMLPYFKTINEVETFIKIVDSRTKTMLLLETPEAVINLDGILEVEGIDYIHIGLNDLHLGYNKKFMFELLADGTVEKVSKKIKNKGIKYGFGGIAKLGKGNLSSEYIIGEHRRLGSCMAILSRSFYDVNTSKNIEEISNVFNKGVSEIRDYEKKIGFKDSAFFEENKLKVNLEIEKIVSQMVSE